MLDKAMIIFYLDYVSNCLTVLLTHAFQKLEECFPVSKSDDVTHMLKTLKCFQANDLRISYIPDLTSDQSPLPTQWPAATLAFQGFLDTCTPPIKTSVLAAPRI